MYVKSVGKVSKNFVGWSNCSQPSSNTIAMVCHHTPCTGKYFDKSRFKFEICMYVCAFNQLFVQRVFAE